MPVHVNAIESYYFIVGFDGHLDIDSISTMLGLVPDQSGLKGGLKKYRNPRGPLLYYQSSFWQYKGPAFDSMKEDGKLMQHFLETFYPKKHLFHSLPDGAYLKLEIIIDPKDKATPGFFFSSDQIIQLGEMKVNVVVEVYNFLSAELV